MLLAAGAIYVATALPPALTAERLDAVAVWIATLAAVALALVTAAVLVKFAFDTSFRRAVPRLSHPFENGAAVTAAASVYALASGEQLPRRPSASRSPAPPRAR